MATALPPRQALLRAQDDALIRRLVGGYDGHQALLAAARQRINRSQAWLAASPIR